MKIGIDLDECLAENVFEFLNWYNDNYKTNFKFNDVREYKFWTVVGGTREEAINLAHKFYESNYFKELPVVFGSKNAIEELKKFSELFVVTSRPNYLINETNRWLEQHFSNKFSNIIFTNSYSKSGEEKRKSDICKTLKLDYMIEDNLEYALDCSRYSKVFLLDKPWNRNGQAVEKIIRVYNWNEILDKIGVENGKTL